MAFDHMVVDLSHHNGDVDLSLASANNVVGVFHKATQGAHFSDPMYAVNAKKAKDNGLLWGAYHFATGEDGAAQADAFLKFVNPGPQTLMVLDFEQNLHGSTMTLDIAHDFINRIQTLTGVFPGLYGGSFLKGLLGSSTDTVLQNCWFWLAQYGPKAVVPKNWADWTLWQYTDGAVGPNPVAIPGIGHCDQDDYNGTVEDLTQKWATGSLA